MIEVKLNLIIVFSSLFIALNCTSSSQVFVKNEELSGNRNQQKLVFSLEDTKLKNSMDTDSLSNSIRDSLLHKQNPIKKKRYPNPFWPSSHIDFEVVEDGSLKIKLYDNKGNLIGMKEYGFIKSGKHLINVNATGFEPGLYIYRILLNNKVVVTKKHLLIK